MLLRETKDIVPHIQKSKITFQNISVNVKFKVILSILDVTSYLALLIFFVFFYLQGRTENQSTWNNFWKKVKILAPFLWPKKNVLLQFRVIFCFLLIAGGRVVNVYVPIYQKKIGE